jgi:pimeloyl-ACP methyl ester carboxylesterase
MPNWPLGAHAVAMAPQASLSVSGMVQLIVDFIVELDLHDVILVGNDTGGALVQMVGASCPQRLARMVLTTCDAYDIFPPPAFVHLTWMGHVPGLAWLAYQLMHHIPASRRLSIAFGSLTDRPLDPGLVKQWIRPLRENVGVRRDVCKFLRTLSSRDTEEAGEALKAFDKPVLLLWSTRCNYFPRRLAERLQRELPHAELHWIDSGGVFVSLEHTAQVAGHIRRFASTPC